MPNHQPLSPSLAAVEHQFADWRRTRTKLSTPRELKEQAVALLGDHRRRQICQVLRISYEMLRRWEAELEPVSSAAFVTLPSPPLPSLSPLSPSSPSLSSPSPSALATPSPGRLSVTLTRQRADGDAVSIAGELDEAQCRWALKLLAEAQV